MYMIDNAPYMIEESERARERVCVCACENYIISHKRHAYPYSPPQVVAYRSNKPNVRKK